VWSFRVWAMVPMTLAEVQAIRVGTCA
jgi:hypothetical protein